VPALNFDPELGKEPNFTKAFPNLDKLPDAYQNQRITSLDTSLEGALALQSKGELEIFGIKIPTESIALLGLPVLAVFLFQFSAIASYTTSRVERLEEEDASQWSFLLSGWRFIGLSYGTIVFLPVAASIVSLIFARGESLLLNAISVAFTIIVLVLVREAFRSLRALRSRVLRNPWVRQKRREV
jgi:hypothetical protein